MREIACRGERLPKGSYDPARERGRTLDRDLLAKYRSHRKFETVPASRHPQPGMSGNPRSQCQVASQTSHDGRRIRVQVKHRPDSFDNKEERAWIAKLNPHRDPDIRLVQR